MAKLNDFKFVKYAVDLMILMNDAPIGFDGIDGDQEIPGDWVETFGNADAFLEEFGNVKIGEVEIDNNSYYEVMKDAPLVSMMAAPEWGFYQDWMEQAIAEGVVADGGGQLEVDKILNAVFEGDLLT